MATGGRGFNGTNQSGSAGTSAALQLATLSIHMWIRDVTSAGGALLEALAAGAYQGFRFALVQGGYTNGLSFYDGAGWNGSILVDIVAASAGAWYPIGVRANGSGTGNAAKFYAGGSPNGTFTPANIPTPAGVTKYLACDVDATHTEGKFSEIGVWSSVLSDANFADLGAGRSPGAISPSTLVSHWRMNESGTSITDLKSGITLTLSNAPSTVAGPTVDEPPGGAGILLLEGDQYCGGYR